MYIAIDGISGKCRVLLAGMIVAISEYQQGLKPMQTQAFPFNYGYKTSIVAMTTIENFSDTLKS